MAVAVPCLDRTNWRIPVDKRRRRAEYFRSLLPFMGRSSMFRYRTLLALSAFAVIGVASSALAAGETTVTPSQERVCRDVSRPGSRIMDRICGTPSEMKAYLQRDWEAKASDPLLASASGAAPMCWTHREGDPRWQPCEGLPPARP